ncbi:MAG: hypothetical protein ACRC1R_11560 [Cetobacterium sp.]|uniref:arsenate reductase/protein-tyrosine-phosphatase family protein n=1 Tax=Cetobacterium sp. TaxID=2071632 RepID=UPI003F368312
MKIVAFVCVKNSFKSIISEKFAKEFSNDFIFVSGGSNPAKDLNLEGKEIMRSMGYSMKGYRPHSLEELPQKVDYLVTMGCGIECPLMEAKKIINFEMDNYKGETYEEKIEIVKILKEKVEKLISDISR